MKQISVMSSDNHIRDLSWWFTHVLPRKCWDIS